MDPGNNDGRAVMTRRVTLGIQLNAGASTKLKIFEMLGSVKNVFSVGNRLQLDF